MSRIMFHKNQYFGYKMCIKKWGKNKNVYVRTKKEEKGKYTGSFIWSD